MAIRRTKEQKMKSQEHRVAAPQYTFSAPNVTATIAKAEQKVASPQFTAQSIFSYDPQLIFDDLKHTLLITAGILVLLGATAYYLK
jgi:hypothetical protein